MVQITGTVHDVTDNPEQVDRIIVRAVEPRIHGATYITEEPKQFPVVDGVLDFDVLPGPCAVALLRPHGATTYEKLMVPDAVSATFRECLDAASLAEEGTQSVLERLAQEVATAAATVQGQVPGLVADAIASDQTVVDAAAAAMNNAAVIAQVEYVKPPLTSSSDIDSLTDGAYPVPNSATATPLGLPEGSQGWLQHIDLDGSRIHRRQYYRVDSRSLGSKDYRRTHYNGSWDSWEPTAAVPHRRGKVPEGLTPDDMTGSDFEGLWNYDSAQAAAWDIPSTAAGFLDISVSGFSTLQEIATLSTPILKFHRRWYNGNWSADWASVGAGQTDAPAPAADEYTVSTSKSAVNLLMPSVVDPTLSYEDDHAALVSDLKSRLGTVSTGGRAAVALVADHGTTVFKEWLWEEAKSRNIPFTMALAPESHLDGKGDSRHTASNDDIKQWISEGLVIASHSGDHSGATGYFDVSRQIQTSKQKLEEKLETQVDCWVQPGYSLATGSYDGFGTGQSASRYTDFYAGRMLQQNYAVVTGYAGDNFVYPGDQDLPVGVRRSLTERKENQAGVIDYIEQAISTGGKHINFCHPYALVDSSSTYVTKSEYIEYLDWLAAKRDAGDLVLLTLPELAVAQ